MLSTLGVKECSHGPQPVDKLGLTKIPSPATDVRFRRILSPHGADPCAMHTSTGLPRGYIISPLTRLNAVATPRLPGSILLETMSEGMISCRACRTPCWPVPDISVVSWTRLRSGYRVDITRK